MVLTFEQEQQLEDQKTDNKIKVIEANKTLIELEHKLKLERLNKILEIAKTGYKVENDSY